MSAETRCKAAARLLTSAVDRFGNAVANSIPNGVEAEGVAHIEREFARVAAIIDAETAKMKARR